MHHKQTAPRIRLALTAFITLIAAGCAHEPTLQDLKVSPSNTLSPSIALHKAIDENARLIVSAQHFSGRSGSALTLRNQTAGSSASDYPLLGSYRGDTSGRGAQQFYYEDIRLTGHSLDEDGQTRPNPRNFSAKAEHSLIQGGLIISPLPHRRVHPEFGFLFKLSRTQIDATETNADQTPTNFSINFDSKSFGVSGILNWTISEHVTARFYREMFIDPFDDIPSHKTGINLLIHPLAGTESGVEFGLYRYKQSDKRNLSEVEFSPNGIEARLNWQL